jgi:hypothetical protein
MKGIVSRLAVGAAVIGAFAALSVIPASAQGSSQGLGPVLMVAQPTNGATYPRGKQWFFGVAYDNSVKPTAEAPAGVDRVEAFAGRREDGGTWLGTAEKISITGAPASQCLSGGCLGLNGKQQDPQLNGPLGISVGGGVPNSGWSIKTYRALRVWMTGTFYFYARSLNGQETVVAVNNITVDPGRAKGKVQP